MVSSRYARDVQPHDVLTARVGRIVHTGPVLHNREALGLPVRRVITIDCRTCAHRDALHYPPAALVTVQRWI